jgi:hypothetical protein
LKEGVVAAVLNAVQAFPREGNILANTLKCLLNLSNSDGRYLRQEEVISALISINQLAMPPKPVPFSPEAERLLLLSLARLSAIRGNQLRLVEEGAMNVIERCDEYQAQGNLPLSLEAIVATIIYNLTTDHRTRIKLIDQGIIKMLLRMSATDNEEVQAYTVLSFRNLVADVACKEKLLNAGAVRVLLRVALDPGMGMDLCKVVGSTIRTLCRDASFSSKLIEEGVIKSIKALAARQDQIVRQLCAECICLLLLESTPGHITKLASQVLRAVFPVFFSFWVTVTFVFTWLCLPSEYCFVTNHYLHS